MTLPHHAPPGELILASASPYRRALLERLGIPFRVEVSGVDEDAARGKGFTPRELAQHLARAKAEAVAARNPSAVVIGSDQIAAWKGRDLTKPGNAENACAQLGLLSGRAHELITALTVLAPQKIHTHTDISIMSMRSLTVQEIARYVQADEPYDCVGSYKLESRGITLFSQIRSDDFSAIIGLPLIALTTILRELGFALP